MAESFDEVDRRILTALSEDGRMPAAELARRAQISESMARRRLERLVGDGLVAVAAIPNPGRVGLTAAALLEFEVEPAHLNAAASGLADLDEIVFVASVVGERQLVASVLLKDIGAYHRFVAERLRDIPGLRSVRSSLIANVYKLPLHMPVPTS